MSITLSGKVAIVTGGGRGIGQGIVRVFAAEGAKVVVASRGVEEGKAVVEAVKRAGGEASFVQTDVKSAKSCRALAEETVRRYGALDILVHNAGIYPDVALEEMSEEGWDDVLDTNLKSCFLLTQAVVPAMKERRGGRIIITSSITGTRVGQARLVHYGTSKGGVNAFALSAALALAKYRITVNAASPGNILIPSLVKLYGQEAVDEMKTAIPAGDLGEPEDIAYAMVYLASDHAKFVTGQALIVDGGQTLPETPDSFERPVV